MNRVICVVFSLLVVSWAQDFSNLFREVERGNLDEVRAQIPQLMNQYPGDDSVVFLAALVKERAEEAIVAYKAIIQNYPNSPYADDALAKVGEYLYARGLYTQASKELSRLPRNYPASEHVQRAIDLQINSLLAIGESDSARYYVIQYGTIFPSLDFNYDFSSERPLASRPLGDTAVTPMSQGMRYASPSLAQSSNTAPSPTTQMHRNITPPSATRTTLELPSPPRPFVVQVGAYGARNNALRQVQQLDQSGFSAELWPITVRGKTLYAVQVIRYGTRQEAEAIGRKLKRELNLTYLVINRPER
ncbi:MAG: hypothetical protein CMG71_04955 [Candidatus Marinimicrobia bacterium]|nr:hypothetical protein [Candidatus Neomarinimicrobiota bacterium]|tara:strand:- start:323 stop:1234 length:912 start_codon:yes stop_codon:yes gene_type:complete